MAPEGGSYEMMRELLISAAMLLPAALWSQSAARPEFEVASVKPNLSGSNLGGSDPRHGNFKANNASLNQLIGFAYDLPTLQISGPGWLESSRYDIDAKGNGEAPESRVRLMVQALLAERFGLQAHRETKEGPVYFLVPMRGGLKAQPADTPNPDPYPNPPAGPHALLRDSHATMTGLAAQLTNFVARPVVDHTGITGEYRVMIWYGNNPETDSPDLFAALQEQLGLKLESGRGPVETLVVDRVNRIPTGN